MNKNILIIKLGAIGDVLMASPSFAAIKKKYPEDRIFVLVGNWAKDVLTNNPNIDEIISVDENIFWKKKVFSLIRLFIELKKKKFSIIYVMHWSNYFNFFAYLLGAKEIIGFERKSSSRYLTRKIIFEEGKEPHSVYKYLNLVDDNYKAYDTNIEIYLSEEEITFAKEELNKYNIEKYEKIVGIFPGGGENPRSKMWTRRWTIENYSKIIKNILLEKKVLILLFGSKSEENLWLEIKKNVNETNRIINFIGRTSEHPPR
ncbi:MAG: glycosyltransferase family 9 protein, partial [Endomicrobiia bacterium]